MRRLLPLSLLLALAVCVPAAQEGYVTPTLDWRRLETRHFTVLYPAAAAAWTLDMASRVDGAYDAVSALVGNAPAERVTLIVEDPNNLSNGFALPFLDAPVIFFWPTPPDPYGGLSGGAGWGELLSVHEYAHLAHLARPSRDRSRALLDRAGTGFGPIAVNAPRWITEGYATFVEGRITGAGRPHSAARAAVLRTWALEGQLPTYGQLDGDPRYLGGSMAYLVGSAFLEWLVARPGQGDSSLPHLWRRMTARTERTFDDAFAGVFGAPPEELYGRFTAELTAQAVALASALAVDSAALGAGAPRTFQRLLWFTGAPALSPNDSLLALTRASPLEPPTVFVWPSHARRDPKADAARKRAQAEDPEDVPGIAWRPPPLPAEAVRHPQGGAPFDAPRWLPDGQHLLLTRNTGAGNGLVRRDLFIWAPLSGSVRRVTRAGGILHADALPDGRSAIADRCVDGICSLVRVDLATGAIATLTAGAPRVTYLRPRVSPDGRTVAASRRDSAGWRVVLVDAATGAVREAGPRDGAERYDGDWRADGRHLVLVSEHGGVPNLEEVDAATGEARALTRVATAVRAPEPRGDDGAVFFLRLHARGLDLDRLAVDSVPPLPSVPAAASAAAYAPAAFEPPVAAPAFPAVPLSPQPYGLGPRTLRALPGGIYGAGGSSIGAMLSGMDPVGKLTWIAQGYLGTGGSWQGGSVGAGFRGWPVTVRAEALYSQDFPSRQWGYAAPSFLDATMAGGLVSAEWRRELVTQRHLVGAGAALTSFSGDTGGAGTRALGWLEYRGRFQQNLGSWLFSEELGATGTAGTTLGTSWQRATVALTLAAEYQGGAIELSGAYGTLSDRAPAYEQPTFGGSAPPFFERQLYGQLFEMPALPAGIASAPELATAGIALTFEGLRPYYWQGSTGPDYDVWERVVGLEYGLSSDGIWFARLPGFRLLSGVGYAYDGPWRWKTRFYAAITFRP